MTLLILALAGIAAAWVLLQPTTADQSAGARFAAKRLLTPNEQEFYRRLLLALPDHLVIAQVAMGALLQPTASASGRAFWVARKQFAQKIVDFAVLNQAFEVLVLIELDDRTHNKLNDAKRDRMTREAGYATLRYESKSKPAIETIRQDVFNLKGSQT